MSSALAATAVPLAALPAGDRAADVRTGDRPRREFTHHQMHARRSRPPSVRGYASQLYATAGWTSLPWLHSIAAPTRVLTGAKDPIVPPINARILGARIPHATMRIIDDAGHLLLMDRAVQSAEHITRFLRSAEPTT